MYCFIIEGNSETKLPTIWTDGKAEVGRVKEGREEERRSEQGKSEKKEDASARKGSVFPMICGSGGSKSRLAKAVGAQPSGQIRDEKLHAVVARSVKKLKTPHVRSTFGSCDVAKNARRCGAKHISKTKVLKTDGLGPLLDVHMSFRVPGARDSAPCQRWAKCEGFVANSKNYGRCATFEEDLQRCMSRGRRSARDMFMRDVRRSGRLFPERGCILEHQFWEDDIVWQVQGFVWPGIPLSWQAQYFRDMECKNCKTHSHDRFLCCQLPGLRKSRRLVLILTLSS